MTNPLQKIKHAFSKSPCCKSTDNYRRILDDVSGEIYPGDLIALMGASGAGKSTLLNVLSRRISDNNGDVFFNDKPATSRGEFNDISCFIQQEDVFFGSLTVKEQLDTQAALRIGPKNEELRLQRVERLMTAFGLTKAQNNRVGNIAMGAARGISGGEKKRLAIACELMTNPSVIFADEPTSGLDSAMAESAVGVLKILADNGRTIVTTIHQPSASVFEMFNKVLLLAEGRMIYFGDRLGAIEWFSRMGQPVPPYTNPADHFIEVLAVPWGAEKEAHIDMLIKWAGEWRANGPSFNEEWMSCEKKEAMAAFEKQFSSRSIGGGSLTPEKDQGADPQAPAEEEVEGVPQKEAEGAVQGEGKVKVNLCLQWIILMGRGFKVLTRNRFLMVVRVVQVLIQSVLSGLLYWR
eukprot:GHVU01035060.1.p1 GENE.GHVU01035060.1~~GHVU01035060.1.p1  ORF type:complete len:407 (-),score=103.19 GHVU01035060.1:1264-2484(-)